MTWPMGFPLDWLLHPFDVAYHFYAWLLAQNTAYVSSGAFPATVLESATSPKKPDFLEGRTVFEAQIRVCGVIITLGLSLVPVRAGKHTCVPMYECVCTCVNIVLSNAHAYTSAYLFTY